MPFVAKSWTSKLKGYYPHITLYTRELDVIGGCVVLCMCACVCVRMCVCVCVTYQLVVLTYNP